jgi:hypothetical protein
VITKIEVVLTGSFTCSGQTYNDVSVAVNSYIIDIVSVKGKNLCSCGTCDGSVTFASEQTYGIPGVNMSGVNTLTITPFYDTICLHSVSMTVVYEANTFGLLNAGVQATWSSGSRTSVSPGQCGVGTYVYIGSGSKADFSFKDPLPSDSLLILASFNLFGRYFGDYYSSCPSSNSLSVQMGVAPALTQTISTPKNETAPLNTNHCTIPGCDGLWQFAPTALYQNGWPGYKYGQTNTVSLSRAYTSGNYNDVDIDYVYVQLWYVNSPVPHN